MLTHNGAVELLKKAIKEDGTAAAFAERVGISPSLLSYYLSGKCYPNRKTLAAIGLRKVVAFEYIPKVERQDG